MAVEEIIGEIRSLASQSDPWYCQPLRIGAIQCESLGDSHRVHRQWKRMGFNTEQLLHISAKEYHGYFREDRVEQIQDYIQAAQAQGLRIIFYINPIWVPQGLDLHPDWRMVHASGLVSNDTGCLNSPFRETIFEQIQRIATFGVDGVFLDGPVFPHDACYCTHCQRLFYESCQESLPQHKNGRDPAWQKFVAFKYDSIARFLCDARQTLKAVNADAMIYMNGLPLSAGAPSARDNRRLIRHQEILGAEGGFMFYGRPDDVVWWKAGATARLLESQAGGKPTVIFIAGDHKPWARYINTPAETRLAIADTVANGANPWYGLHSPIEDMQTPGGQAADVMMQWLKKHEIYFSNTESIAEIALMWSGPTADFYSMESELSDFTTAQSTHARISYRACFEGFCEMLLRLHMPFDIIDEQTLTEKRLSKYRTIILPNAALLSEEHADRIRQFVQDGGKLLTTFETGLYDEKFNRRKNFALADVMGADAEGEFYDFGALGYMSCDKQQALFEECTSSLLPAPMWGLRVAASTATSLAKFHGPLTDQYKSLPEITTPAIVTHSYGEGCSYYFAGNYGEHYRTFGIVDNMTIVEQILRQGEEPLIQCTGLPQTVEVVLRQQIEHKRLLVHLVNFTGAMRRPIAKIVPISEGQLQIASRTLKKVGISKSILVRELVSGRQIPVEYDGDRLVIPLGRLLEYEVIVIESTENHE